MKNWKPSPQFIEDLRLRNLGKKHSEETKRKQSINQIGLRLGWKHKEGTKTNLSKILKEVKPIERNGLSYRILKLFKTLGELTTKEVKIKFNKDSPKKVKITINSLNRYGKIKKMINTKNPSYSITQEGVDSVIRSDKKYGTILI